MINRLKMKLGQVRVGPPSYLISGEIGSYYHRFDFGTMTTFCIMGNFYLALRPYILVTRNETITT